MSSDGSSENTGISCPSLQLMCARFIFPLVSLRSAEGIMCYAANFIKFREALSILALKEEVLEYLENFQRSLDSAIAIHFAILISKYDHVHIASLVGPDLFQHLLAKEKEFQGIKKSMEYLRSGVVLEPPRESEDKYTPDANGCYPLAVLVQGVAWPSGVDPARREQFLYDSEFEAIFHMTKATFASLPKLDRIRLKKEKNLF